MHIGRLEHVVIHLVVVVDGSHKVSAQVLLVVEALQAAVDAHVRVEAELGVGVVGPLGVHPFLDVQGASAVVDPVGYVCRLRVDGAHLTYYGHLCQGDTVDLNLGSRVGFFAVDKLLDSYWTEGLFCVVLEKSLGLKN